MLIKKEFKRVSDSIAGVIREQRQKILGYFGPLVGQRKKPAYALLGNTEKKVDLSLRRKICLPYKIRIKIL